MDSLSVEAYNNLLMAIFLPLFFGYMAWLAARNERNSNLFEKALISKDPEFLEKYSKDRSGFVRAGVAINRLTPLNCLQELSNDPDIQVRNMAKRTLKQFEKYGESLRSYYEK